MRYVQLGDVPVKHHIQFKQPDGTLYKEQLFGTQGFSGRSSTMYHIHLPTCVSEIERIGERRLEAVPDDMLKHRHLKTRSFQAQGDAVSGRIPLCFNNDVILAYARTTDRMSYFFKNADGDEALYIHQGSGRLESMFGTLSYTSGDYLIIPRGTIYRLVEETVDTEIFVVESLSPIEIPRRYRNEYGQLLEHAPYRERDIRVPDTLETHRKDGRYKVRILARGIFHDYYYDFHPFDIVGWDGYVYPWAFNIHNYQPITGLVHMPPPTLPIRPSRPITTSSVLLCRACWTIIRMPCLHRIITAISTAMKSSIMRTINSAAEEASKQGQSPCTRPVFHTVPNRVPPKPASV
jgi:homogentisate 1,2-dioxygenase